MGRMQDQQSINSVSISFLFIFALVFFAPLSFAQSSWDLPVDYAWAPKLQQDYQIIGDSIYYPHGKKAVYVGYDLDFGEPGPRYITSGWDGGSSGFYYEKLHGEYLEEANRNRSQRRHGQVDDSEHERREEYNPLRGVSGSLVEDEVAAAETCSEPEETEYVVLQIETQDRSGSKSTTSSIEYVLEANEHGVASLVLRPNQRRIDYVQCSHRLCRQGRIDLSSSGCLYSEITFESVSSCHRPAQPNFAVACTFASSPVALLLQDTDRDQRTLEATVPDQNRRRLRLDELPPLNPGDRAVISGVPSRSLLDEESWLAELPSLDEVDALPVAVTPPQAHEISELLVSVNGEDVWVKPASTPIVAPVPDQNGHRSVAIQGGIDVPAGEDDFGRPIMRRHSFFDGGSVWVGTAKDYRTKTRGNY